MARVGLLDREDRAVLRGDADRGVCAADGQVDADPDRARASGGPGRGRAAGRPRRWMRAMGKRDDAQRRKRRAQNGAA
jgi:hypothetical protein